MIIQNFVSGLVLLCGIIRLTGANNGFKFVYNNSPSHTIELTAIYPNFAVKSYKFGDSEWKNRDEAQNPIVITNFFACTQYELAAMVTSETGLQEFLHKETLITGCGESGPIKFVNITSESNSIKITLDFKHIDCVDSFYVMLNSSRSIYYTKYNLTKVLTVSELTPCSIYHMYLLVNVHIPFTIFVGNVNTISPPELRPIENIYYDKTTGLLIWSPAILNDCLLSSHYVISIKQEHSKNGLNFDRESAKNEFDLNFLLGCSKFLVSINPKGHDDLIGTARIRTGYRTPGPVVKLNVQVKHNAISLIKWDSPTVNPACVTQYSVQINGVWITTLANRLPVPHCRTCEIYNITVCIVDKIALENCVHYRFDSKLKQLTLNVLATTEKGFPTSLPSIYRSNDWGVVSMDSSSENYALLQIQDMMAPLLISFNISLFIHDRTCGIDLVPSFKLYENDDKDSFSFVQEDNCTIHCYLDNSLKTIPISLAPNGTHKCMAGSFELKKETTYQIMARIATPKSYTDTNIINFSPNKANETKLTFLWYGIIALVGLVGLFVIITLIGFRCRSRQNLKIKTDPTLIEVQNFSSFYKSIDKSFIRKEYQSINDINLDHLTKLIAQNHADKNRCNDIVPYDHNRVHLIPNEYCTVDYINASFINGIQQIKQYIAAQGPKDDTVYEFWSMILDEECEKIIMLTPFGENNIECFKYFPNLKNIVWYHDIKVTTIEEFTCDSQVIRLLTISKGDKTSYIRHFQYMAWANHDVPEHTLDMIKFVENTGGQTRLSTIPIVVHSSAGVGRTGTFIALDILLERDATWSKRLGNMNFCMLPLTCSALGDCISVQCLFNFIIHVFRRGHISDPVHFHHHLLPYWRQK